MDIIDFSKPIPQESVPKPVETLADDIETFVLAHPAKPAITAETLGQLDWPYTLYNNTDWDWPEDHPELRCERHVRPMLRGYALRQYRAFRGHQEICRQATKPFTLVFEDDAQIANNTNPDDVIRHINAARNFINEMGYDAVSFHGRKLTAPTSSTTVYGREYVELSRQHQEGTGHQEFLRPVRDSFNGKYQDYIFAWHEGCLAYLIGEQGRQKWVDAGHGYGMPCDLFLVNELNTLVMRHSIFHHDHRHGSLISNQGRVALDLNPDGTPADVSIVTIKADDA